MLFEERHLKDPERNLSDSYGAGTSNMSFSMSNNKANKLVTALYMVTDIIDKDEPIRLKLRTLGVEIISDTNSSQTKIGVKINEVMSFLDIATAMNFVSPMNHSILKKEFINLKKSIEEKAEVKPTWLSEFLENSSPEEYSDSDRREMDKFFHPVSQAIHPSRGELNSQRQTPTRIGVQKGSTLMKALSDKSKLMSNTKTAEKENFDIVKLQRRNDIINILRLCNGNATIKDIKDKIKAAPEKVGDLVSCGEKTLQRELVSMVKDGVLNKTGEKRWSRYYLKNS